MASTEMLDPALDPQHLTLKFPKKSVESFFRTHDLFIARCRHILDGLFEYEAWYCNALFRHWLHKYEELVGRDGIAELIFRLLRLDFIELLIAPLPPSLEQLLSFSKEETEKFMACYLCLVEYGGETLIYTGSATAQDRGFLTRLSRYNRLDLGSMPVFIRNLVHEEEEFRILVVLPILRLFPQDGDDIVFGDMRIPILLIETVMMIWFRCFKKGGAYEKLMKFSPWSVDEVSFVRSNRCPSTQTDWPIGALRTEEQLEALEKAKKNIKGCTSCQRKGRP